MKIKIQIVQKWKRNNEAKLKELKIDEEDALWNDDESSKNNDKNENIDDSNSDNIFDDVSDNNENNNWINEMAYELKREIQNSINDDSDMKDSNKIEPKRISSPTKHNKLIQQHSTNNNVTDLDENETVSLHNPINDYYK